MNVACMRQFIMKVVTRKITHCGKPRRYCDSWWSCGAVVTSLVFCNLNYRTKSVTCRVYSLKSPFTWFCQKFCKSHITLVQILNFILYHLYNFPVFVSMLN